MYVQIVVFQEEVEKVVKMVKRDKYLYTIRNKGKVVKFGISNDPDRRAIELENERLRFTSIKVDTHPRTWDSAKSEETRRIRTYESNQGKKPRYNKIF